MSVKLDQLKIEIDELSDEELADLIEYVRNRLKQRKILSRLNSDRSVGFLPRPTPEEIEADLAQIFTPEELAMPEVEIPPSPPGTPTMTDIVSWGRESSIYQPSSEQIEAHLAEIFTREN